MLAWFSKRANATWSRTTRWTPLLQNQREFQRTLTKERSRVDRSGNCFGFIILRLTNLSDAKAQTQKLSKLLHRRLRDTDEKGHLGLGRLGIVLPETGHDETDFVLNDILKIAGEANLKIDGEAFVYPDNTGTPTKSRSQSGSADSGGVPATQSVGMPLAMMLPKYPAWKRGLDIVGASAGLLLGSPLLVTAAILVKATSRGPIFFSQQRTGYLGLPFSIYKLRTMVVNAEELKASLAADNERDGPAFKMRKDPRITSVGHVLRATGLDELPQLYNVLIGDMSLVGPRPLPVSEADQCAPWQKRRHDVRPGVTCFWQISKSRCFSFADWMRLDLSYARSISPTLDVKLICKTFASVVLGRVGH